ncbi:MAG: glycosyltransferase [bacterium]|nr:glycosyltransferase [bacterium]
MSLPNSSFVKDVSIIIPVHNRCDLTEKCLASIAGAHNDASYEVIIIDNASTDRTRDLLGAIDGDITVITNRTNEGFAKACNRGARVALGEYLLFLNNDTEVTDGYLDGLIAQARQMPNCGAVGARLCYPKGRIRHAGIAIEEDGTPYHIFQNFDAAHPAVTASRKMNAVTAACMLISKHAFDLVEGFDCEYRNGFEDVDLCLKLRDEGYTNIYCGNVKVVHCEESSEGRKTYDRENLSRLRSKWQGTLKQDDFDYLRPLGLTIEWGQTGGTYRKLAQDSLATTDKSGQDLLDRAQKMYLEGKHAEAAELLTSIVSSKMSLGKDDEFESWQLLGNCMARLNRALDAEKAYLQAAERNADSERPFLGLGSVAMLQENWTAAQYGFMAALSKNPNTLRAEFGLGISLSARGNNAEAIEHFKRVAEKEPRNAEAVFYLYRAAMEANRPHEAVGALSRFLEEYPNDAEYWFHLAGAQWKSGSPDDAIESCKRVLELNPKHKDAQSTLSFMEQHVAAHA